jgi:hypothetical protein
MCWINARPGIAHGHEDAVVVLFGADQQLSCPCLARAHCFDRIQDQVQDDLLQLNAIAVNGRQSPGKPALNRNAILHDCTPRQDNYFVDRRIEIAESLSGRRFLDVIADSVDDVSSAIGIGHDAAERLLGLPQIRRLLVQRILA